MISLAQMIHHLADRHHESTKVAVICGDQRLTYADLRDHMVQCAAVLSYLGVGGGSRVMALMGNCLGFPALVGALAGLNASLSPVSVHFVVRELRDTVTYLRPSVLVVDSDHEKLARSAIEGIAQEDRPRVLVVDHRCLPVHEEEMPPGDTGGFADAARRPDPAAFCYLAFTGGTTGACKAAAIRADRFYETILLLAVHLGISKDDVSLVCGSFSHTMPFYYAAAQLYCGGTVVILPAFNARRALDAIEEHRVTWFAAVPTMYTDMLESAASDPTRDLGSLMRYVSSGAPLLTATKERLKGLLGPNLVEYYGATELGWVSTLEPRDHHRKRRCVGQPMLGTEIRILDEQGQPVSAGETGLIYTSGNILMSRYFEYPSEDAKVFHGDWATAGDLGYLDDEGYLFLVDRQKDMIVTGGVNVFPVEIEEVLTDVPSLIEVACIGEPDARWGEAVLAVCVIDPSLSEQDWESLARDRVKTELSSYKQPKRYEFVDALPRSHAGKVLKRALRESRWQGAEL